MVDLRCLRHRAGGRRGRLRAAGSGDGCPRPVLAAAPGGWIRSAHSRAPDRSTAPSPPWLSPQSPLSPASRRADPAPPCASTEVGRRRAPPRPTRPRFSYWSRRPGIANDDPVPGALPRARHRRMRARSNTPVARSARATAPPTVSAPVSLGAASTRRRASHEVRTELFETIRTELSETWGPSLGGACDRWTAQPDARSHEPGHPRPGWPPRRRR